MFLYARKNKDLIMKNLKLVGDCDWELCTKKIIRNFELKNNRSSLTSQEQSKVLEIAPRTIVRLDPRWGEAYLTGKIHLASIIVNINWI